jgi:hypothetical protein
MDGDTSNNPVSSGMADMKKLGAGVREITDEGQIAVSLRGQKLPDPLSR